MNINQQAEIEDLFRRINKTISKNQKTNVGDEDLNKVRAYIVQSKRAPIQSHRLETHAGRQTPAARERRTRNRREVQQLEGADHQRGPEAGDGEEEVQGRAAADDYEGGGQDQVDHSAVQPETAGGEEAGAGEREHPGQEGAHRGAQGQAGSDQGDASEEVGGAATAAEVQRLP